MIDIENTKTRTARTLPDSMPLLTRLYPVYSRVGGIANGEPICWTGKKPLTVGRQTSGSPRASNYLALTDERVSREHARISSKDCCTVIQDLDSKNGTRVNGRRLVAGELLQLADGDVIEVGDSYILHRREPALLTDADAPLVVGVSAAACKLRHEIKRCSKSVRAALLLGETGTGKGVAAQAIHTLSKRTGKLVTVNCAAVPASLAESLFFGVKRGAYTEAAEHSGLFGEAHKGTLLLDEVGDLPYELQAKLLLAIESHEVTPLGSTQPVKWDVRILAATNRNLKEGLRAGTFREDLYARLSASVVHLPALRERKEDVLLLAQHLAGHPLHPAPRTVAAMLRYDWPGNVREVDNIVSQLLDGDLSNVLQHLESISVGSGVVGSGRHTPKISTQEITAPASPSSASAPPVWHAGDPVPSQSEVLALLKEYQGSLRRIELRHGYPRRQFRRWVERYGIDLSQYRQASDS